MNVTARHYRTGQPLAVTCEHGTIARVEPAADGDLPWIAPAFCDVQINGADGFSFNSDTLTIEQIRQVVATCRRHGIAQLLPTLVTASFDALIHGSLTIRAAWSADADQARAIVGIHLEGPYISPEDGPRGAHPKEHVRSASWDEFRQFQDAAGGMIRMLTLAPETPGALPFIEKVAAAGIIVAIGHTAASPACIRDAVTAGATMSTHLGNGSHSILPRHENYIWEQLADDRLMASMIADGHHLPESVMRCILRGKTPARLILTCDASPLAGCPQGRYRQWHHEFDVVETKSKHGVVSSKVVLAGTPYLGGSGAFTDTCVANMLELGEAPMPDVLDMAGNGPRRLLGLPERTIAVGEPAELVVFDWSPETPFVIRQTLV